MPNHEAPPVLPLATTAPRRSFERLSLSRQFMLISAGFLLLCMFAVGAWLSMEIERSAVNRAAAIAAVYVESILAAQLHPTPEGVSMMAGTHEAFDQIFKEGPLRRKVVRFKLWDPQGTILYSSDHTQLGRRYAVAGPLAAALAGAVQANISELAEVDNAAERELWSRLIEVYVPVRADPQSKVVAVAEFYHATDNLDRDIKSAQRRSWILVTIATTAIILLMFMQIRRANDTILQQRNDLRQKLTELRAAFAENERMRVRLGEAGAKTTALNEQFLHRIAADLHDAPAQTLAFALMRIDELADAAATSPELQSIRRALRSSLDDLRNIAAGLGIPGIADLSLVGTAQRAVRDFERRAGGKVETDIEATLPDASLATKITLYRLLQESLANSKQHAPGAQARVRVWRMGEQVQVEVADAGSGFDIAQAAQSGRLGIAFMQERVRLLGGSFAIESAPGHGTRILASLPVADEEGPHD